MDVHTVLGQDMSSMGAWLAEVVDCRVKTPTNQIVWLISPDPQTRPACCFHRTQALVHMPLVSNLRGRPMAVVMRGARRFRVSQWAGIARGGWRMATKKSMSRCIRILPRL